MDKRSLSQDKINSIIELYKTGISVRDIVKQTRVTFPTIEKYGGDTAYKAAIKENYPDSYRILCFNCNCSLGHRGYCPHGLVRTQLCA